ncbi:PadR family transcriptional regulator [Kitasatospora sp. NBC_01287]|uniref:PadR family transcriptional regulator n=1 Tax=Kitasatospora sp. NBC_01287 TaxID=2903573 RepID=UPI002251CF5A|nr:PadR family transcriptional regulator [Kitasatospora sp. NBC_01287]MCX4746226.1 PadR family transcriptional regulator [Kitasatospora sp. NBC_01287]
MAKRRAVANPLALAVMAELVVEPMHPYEMGRRLKEHGKERTIKYNRSSLYMVVEQLRKAGFVAEQETVRDTQRPERTVYALTEAGRGELGDWMRELVADPQAEYPKFGVALSLLAIVPPLEAAELLGRRLAALGEQLADVREQLRIGAEQQVPWIFLIEEDYRLGVLEAEERFVTNLIESVERPDYVRYWRDFFEKP